MWPWEHAIVGYLAYSLFSRLYYRESPTGLAAFAAVFASVLPDLIDKPLAWEFGVFQAGYALGHSIFFAIPLAIVVGVLARAAGRTPAGIAFGLGYLLHLPSDVLDGYLRGGHAYPELMLWPVETVSTNDHSQGFLEQFSRLFGQYQQDLLAGELSTYIWLQLGLAALAALVWLADGAPVLRECFLGGKRFVVSRIPSNSRSERPSNQRK
ncbi:metal-dependent hydrolase [Natronorubrum aibiense]|uniref:Metal-dependent hydrolase n=1 Tax=Natronorubrum aibiense TaxID=348826 RepID=A0A5P9PAA2_9EURY|nr:metal-dependent hydrolase [Natronorubrum aibiense]QFU85024.1 metal-dependent hydrolase [Natronorubrum aibiense]